MDQIITSASNPSVKWLRKIAGSAKLRREEGLSLADGTHLAASIIKSNLVIKAYFCAKSALGNPEVSNLLEELNQSQPRKIILSDDLFESITSTHARVGISVIFETPVPGSQESHLDQASLLLEGVQDPGNLGTILRTAVAAGISQVYLDTNCASAWSPRTLRSGMGAQFGLTIHESADLPSIVKAMKMPVLATTLSSKSLNLYSVDLSRPSAWIFGSEGRGVSQNLINLADKSVHVPQVESPVESLNVAAAVGVCLYEQVRQQKYSDSRILEVYEEA